MFISVSAATLVCDSGFASEAPTRCDELAANPHDPQRNAPGVLFYEIDASAAVSACKEAVDAQPGVVRLQYQFAVALARAHRWTEAATWMGKAAREGYAVAEADLAYLIADADPKESLRLVELAAAQDLPVAVGDLGWRYMNGIVVDRDYRKALALFRRAIDAGDEYSMCHLGQMYEYGWGVTQDDAQAVKWYRAASDRRYRGGWYHLAMMLLAGQGGARDEAEAERLLAKAAAEELPEAETQLLKLRAKRAR